MYKYIFILLLLKIPQITYSQDSLNTAITYTSVIKVDSTLSSKELYLRARTWFAETYRSAQDVIQLDDKDNFKIVGKGNIKYTSRVFVGSEGTKGWIRYTISINLKNGRYKYEISDFYHEGNPANPGGQFSFNLITNSTDCPYKIGGGKSWNNKVWNDIKETIDKNIKPLIESLVIAMGKPANSKENDW